MKCTAVQFNSLGSIYAATPADIAEEPEDGAARKCHCGQCGGGQKLAVNPTVLLCWAMIESARVDASRTCRGEPTRHAREARTWLAQHVDPRRSLWEKRHWLGSFQWCCAVVSVGGLMGRPLREPDYWRQRWLTEIDQRWQLAATAYRRTGKEMNRRKIRTTPQAAPAEPPTKAEVHPPVADALQTPVRRRTGEVVSDSDRPLPPLTGNERFDGYQVWCWQRGLPWARFEFWHAMQPNATVGRPYVGGG